jgi:DNA (cytosine-5)-methyltransferase 1
LDGITFSKWRNESIKGYGNAVVPQVVHQIFKAIGLYESTSHETNNPGTT